MNRDEIRRQRDLRRDLLEQLYAARLENPGHPWQSERALEQQLGDHRRFALGVLEELGQVRREGGQYRITATGVIACEEK